MSNTEIMAAIGEEVDYLFSRPPLGTPCKLLLQKLNERNLSFVQQIFGQQARSQVRIKREGFSRRESRSHSRSSTPSSNRNSKIERSPTALALRYDDLPTNAPPAPVTPKALPPPPQDHPALKSATPDSTSLSRQSSVVDLVPEKRTLLPRVDSQYSSYSIESCSTYKPSPLRSSSSTQSLHRPRSSPSEMTEQELDDWLEKPEDAEEHRKRKRFLTNTTSNRSSAESLSVDAPRNIHSDERTVKRLTMSWMSDSWEDEYESDGAPEIEDLSKWQISSTFFGAAWKRHNAAAAKRACKMASFPDEVLQNIARHLDETNVSNLRTTCKKMHKAIPAPSRPLLLKE